MERGKKASCICWSRHNQQCRKMLLKNLIAKTLFWQKARSWSCCCWRDGCPVLPDAFFAFQPYIINCTEVHRLNLKWIILTGQFHSTELYGI